MSTIAKVLGEPGLASFVLLRSKFGSKSTEHDKHGKEGYTKDDDFSHGRACATKLSPRAVGLTNVLLELISAKLVVDKTSKGNGVTESLEQRDRIVEQEHGAEDEKNILEHAREGKDKGGGLSNLKN